MPNAVNEGVNGGSENEIGGMGLGRMTLLLLVIKWIVIMKMGTVGQAWLVFNLACVFNPQFEV